MATPPTLNPRGGHAMKRQFTRVAGDITISRPTNADSTDHPHLRIVIRMPDYPGRGLVFEVGAEDFLLTLTGRSEVPAHRIDAVGATSAEKVEVAVTSLFSWLRDCVGNNGELLAAPDVVRNTCDQILLLALRGATTAPWPYLKGSGYPALDTACALVGLDVHKLADPFFEFTQFPGFPAEVSHE